ncbi:MAG: hypothetical protein II221_00880 [Paludibacteraceae bacterium]|nr:hypothetical protein [Paludibacteraceae bacterium]
MSDLQALQSEFLAKCSALSAFGPQVDPFSYYRDMFPAGSFESSDSDERRPNGLLTVLNDQELRGRSYNRLIFDDLSIIAEYSDKLKVVIPPVAFSGKRRLSKYAYQIFGFVFDLDDVGVEQIGDLVYQMQNDILPFATYLVNSGTGLHIVYLFDNPIPAMPQYYESLIRLKKDLSDKLWNRYTSRSEEKQYQGIFQPFRVVGSPTKLGADYLTTAYKIGSKVTLNYLNSFADEENRCNFNDLTYTSLPEARESYPEWYERRIIEKRPIGDYKLTEAQKLRRRSWYNAWIERMKKGAFDGNRYYCMGVLFHYAMKAEIPLEEAYQDALGMLDLMNAFTTKEGNEFTENDILAATKCYDRKFIKMGREGILRHTKIDIGVTKRNGRSQKEHLQSEYIFDNGKKKINTCYVNRKLAVEKRDIVEGWRIAHPDGTKYACAKETGLSKNTVRKWWGD